MGRMGRDKCGKMGMKLCLDQGENLPAADTVNRYEEFGEKVHIEE